MQEAVREFHEAMGQPAPGKYTELERKELRLNLIQEELDELATALGCNVGIHGEWVEMDGGGYDEEGVVDAISDILYVVLGTAVEMGLPVQRFFAEVHRSNMTKVGGPVREDGKILKPDTYEPPRIKCLLERLKKSEG